MGFFRKLGQLWWRDEEAEPEEPVPEFEGEAGFTGRIGLGGEIITTEEADSFLEGKMVLWCDSTNVQYAKYNHQYEQMEIGFNNGSAYLYSGWSLDLALSFLEAPSKGIFIWDRVRVRGKGNSGATQLPYIKISSTVSQNP